MFKSFFAGYTGKGDQKKKYVLSRRQNLETSAPIGAKKCNFPPFLGITY